MTTPSIATSVTLPERHAISRAKLFLDLADPLPGERRNLHEAYLEAAIVFARTALHRLQTRYRKSPGWKLWFDGVLGNSSVQFIRNERDWILKEAPPKIGQVAYAQGIPAPGEQPTPVTLRPAKDHYYYETSDIAAVDTLRQHVSEIERLIIHGENLFGGGAPIRS